MGGTCRSINVQNNGAGWVELTSIHTYKACFTLARKIIAGVVFDTVSTQCVHKGTLAGYQIRPPIFAVPLETLDMDAPGYRLSVKVVY